MTARHLVETIRTRGIVRIQHDDKWVPVDVELVGHGEGPVDISVLAPQSLFGPPHHREEIAMRQREGETHRK